MAKKRITWSRISAGDVIEFRYKSPKKGGKSRLRTCLILNEKHMYQRISDGKRVRLVHALQLSAIPKAKGTRLLKENHVKRLFKQAGKIEIREDGATAQRYAIQGSRFTANKQYKKLRNLVTQYGIYRTFSWTRLKTKACFMVGDEWDKWPDDLLNELQSKSPSVDEEEI